MAHLQTPQDLPRAKWLGYPAGPWNSLCRAPRSLLPRHLAFHHTCPTGLHLCFDMLYLCNDTYWRPLTHFQRLRGLEYDKQYYRKMSKSPVFSKFQLLRLDFPRRPSGRQRRPGSPGASSYPRTASAPLLQARHKRHPLSQARSPAHAEPHSPPLEDWRAPN